MLEKYKNVFIVCLLCAVVAGLSFFSELETIPSAIPREETSVSVESIVTSSDPLPRRNEEKQETPPLEEVQPTNADINIPPPVPEKTETYAEEKFSLPAQDIDIQSLVGIQCNYENAAGKVAANRGSGVFINSSGYILTNRHLVDRAWTNAAYGDNLDLSFVLEDCDIRFYENAATISSETPDARFFELGMPDFKAVVAFLPNEEGLSDMELKRLDFAILRVTKKNESKYLPYENPKIHAAAVFLPKEDTMGDWITEIKKKTFLALGFPFQGLSANPEIYFQEYRLFSKQGTIVDVYGGDLFFLNKPFLFKTEIEPDAYGGRSGSPMFYRGYVVGVFMTVGIPPKDTSTKFITSTQLSLSAISENLGMEKTRELFENIAFR